MPRPYNNKNVHEPTIIGIVDAQRFTKKEVYSPSTTQLLEEQLRYSDTIILNKTDLIGEEALNEVKENLNKLNPQAPIIITTYSQFNDEQINGKVIQHNEIQHKHIHHHGIQSMQYTFTAAMTVSYFINLLCVCRM